MRSRPAGEARWDSYPALYIRDPDQTAYTTGGQAWIAGASNTAAAQAAVLSILDWIRVQDAEDNWWVIDDDDQEVHGGHFGMVPDGALNELTNAMTGTDNSAALQAVIDWRLYLTQYSRHVKPIDIPGGTFRLASVVQLGYSAYVSACLRGTNSAFANGYGGTILLLDVANNPGFAFNTVANGSVEDITFYGKLLSFINAEGFCGIEPPDFDDTLIANWFPGGTPALDPRLRYNPLCAIAIDPYAGSAPATAYNPPLPPAWLPDAVRIGYGKAVGCTKIMPPALQFLGLPGRRRRPARRRGRQWRLHLVRGLRLPTGGGGGQRRQHAEPRRRPRPLRNQFLPHRADHRDARPPERAACRARSSTARSAPPSRPSTCRTAWRWPARSSAPTSIWSRPIGSA